MNYLKILIFSIILVSNSYSQVWFNQVNPSPGVMFSIYAYNENIAWATGELGKVLYTSNGGTNWQNRTNVIFGTSNVYSVHATDPVSAFVVCNINGGKVFKTQTQGLSWQTSFSRSNVVLSDVQFLDANTGFIFGNPYNGKYFIIKTVNGGNTFDTTSVTRPNAPNPNSQIIPNCTYVLQNGVGGPIFIWFGTSTGEVFYSTNTGISWSSSTPDPGISVLSITFSSAQNGLLGGDSPFMSINGGSGWIFQNSYPNTGRFFSFENVAGEYFYSSGPGIYHSTNNAASFTLQFTNSSKEDYRDLSFVSTPGDNSLSVIHGWGVTGDGVISTYSEPIGIIPVSTNIPEDFYLYQNYPNPFNPATVITFDIAHTGKVKLEVLDLLGRQAAVIFEGRLRPGKYKTDFDGTNLASGIYFYRMITENDIITKKFSLLK